MHTNKTEPYLCLSPLGLSPCTFDSAAQGDAEPKWHCTDCCSVRTRTAAIDISVQESEREITKPLSFVSGFGLGLIHNDFLDLLEKSAVQKSLLLGNVFCKGGRRHTSFSTYIARSTIIVRGTDEAAYRQCKSCGRIAYFAMGRKYLYPAPDPAVEIFEDYASLVVKQSVAAKIDKKKWRSLRVEILEVADKPFDNLGDLNEKTIQRGRAK